VPPWHLKQSGSGRHRREWGLRFAHVAPAVALIKLPGSMGMSQCLCERGAPSLSLSARLTHSSELPPHPSTGLTASEVINTLAEVIVGLGKAEGVDPLEGPLDSGLVRLGASCRVGPMYSGGMSADRLEAALRRKSVCVIESNPAGMLRLVSSETTLLTCSA
jgi:hypothetical protein